MIMSRLKKAVFTTILIAVIVCIVEGLSAAYYFFVIDAKTREMQDFKKMYDNPLANAALTFMEPFPLGVLATVVSAVALRKK